MNKTKKENMKKLLKNNNLSDIKYDLVGTYIRVDELNDIFKELDEYRKGKLGGEDSLLDNEVLWYDNVISTQTSTVSKLQVVNKDDEIYNIVVRSEEMSGDMIEDVHFAGYQTSDKRKDLTITMHSEDLETHYGLEQEHFEEFVNWLEMALPDFLAESDFLSEYIKIFKKERSN